VTGVTWFMDDRRVLVLYATETGNAFDVAVRIDREGKKRGLNVAVQSVDAYPLDNLINENVVLFVVSTTGSGAEPRSLRHLWSLLIRSELPNDLFDGLHYSIFGLGDSSYEKFCWPAKKLDRRIQSLGGSSIIERGEGDDRHPFGYEGTLELWLRTFFNAMRFIYPELPYNFASSHTASNPIVSLTFETIMHLNGGTATPVDDLRKRMTVLQNQRITHKDWFQDVRHIVLEGSAPTEHQPGDVAMIYPQNSDEDVNEFLQLVGWRELADKPVCLRIDPGSSWRLFRTLPHQSTLRHLLKTYLDFSAIPGRNFFESIYPFARNGLEKEKLQEFGTIDGQDELYEYCQRVRRTILEVFQDFTSIRLPLDYLFDVVPLLRPRQFSIANSAMFHPRQIHLCVAIVSFQTKLRKPRRGACTHFLASLPQGYNFDISIQPSTIQLPNDIRTPVLCIGPGTGIAPMRSVIEQRIFDGATENTLYFGCRSEFKDQHYREEWLQYKHDNMLRYCTAFSRDAPLGMKRVYVQDIMKADLLNIGSAIVLQGAYVYISGSSNQMPRAVRKVLADAVEIVQDCSEDESRAYLSRMEESGQLFEECWS